jgi:phage/conjugal plasmid C-4 type zinc finger TraR family protein
MDDLELADESARQETERLISEARQKLGSGESLEHCEDCEQPIPKKRRLAVPGCRRCVACQQEFERWSQ